MKTCLIILTILIILFVVGILVAGLVVFALASYGNVISRYFEETHEEL